MVTFESINLKPSYCIFNHIKHIDLNLLSITKKCIKNIDAVSHEIKYIIKQNKQKTKKNHNIDSDNQNNIDNELPLCLSFNDIDS